LVQLEALNLGIKLLVLNIYKPYVDRILLEGLQLGVILSLMARTAMEKISDDKDQRWQRSAMTKISDGKDQR
jgi:hypothetical protein